MAKLSEAQVKGLRAVRDNRGEFVNARTRKALQNRFAVKWDAGDGWVLTPTGRTLLDEHERAEKARQEQAERASRPVPAGAFVEPSARTAPVMGLEYDEESDDFVDMGVTTDAIKMEEAPRESGPSVQLTPRPAEVEQEATDAEILQLLAVLDHGVTVARSLYRDYTVSGPAWLVALDMDKLNRAARDAVRFGLARQTYAERLYRLDAEPVHLLTGDGQVTPCGRYPEAARKSGKRLRVTADPAKVTHDFCK